MRLPHLSSITLLGSLVAVACSGGRIHEVGDINSAGGTSDVTTDPTETGGGTSQGGTNGATADPTRAEGAGGLDGGDWYGNAGRPESIVGGIGGTTDAGNTNSRGGGSSTGGVFIDPPDPTSEGITLYLAWVDFMSGSGHKDLEVAWYNGTDHSIFIDTSCPADWWRLKGESWVVGLDADHVCPSSSGIRLAELLPGAYYHHNGGPNLVYYGAGTYRLRGTFWLGCGTGNVCSSPHQAASSAVNVVVRVTGTASTGSAGASSVDSSLAGAAGVGSTVGPNGLHATCSADGPCTAGQTAVAVFYTGSAPETCACEIPCVSGSTTCPPDTSCEFVSDGLGSLCQ
jgi:hypothetical protein